GKRRPQPAEFVSSFAQAWCVPICEGIVNRLEVIRQASSKRLTDILQNDGVASAGSQEHTWVEQARSRSVGRRPCINDPVNGRPQVRGLDRLGEEIVHAGREAPLAVFFARARRQSHDRQMAARRLLLLSYCLDDLEA